MGTRQGACEAARKQIRVLLENAEDERVSSGIVGRIRAAGDALRQAEAAEMAVSGEGRQ